MVCLCEVLSASCSWLEPTDMGGFALSPVHCQAALAAAPGPTGTGGIPVV